MNFLKCKPTSLINPTKIGSRRFLVHEVIATATGASLIMFWELLHTLDGRYIFNYN